jgi:hypothetical protein
MKEATDLSSALKPDCIIEARDIKLQACPALSREQPHPPIRVQYV